MSRRPLLVGLLVLCLAGCSKWSFRSQSADKDEDVDEKAATTFIGDQVTFAGLHPIQIEGVALVTGLDGTGEDPAPSLYRTLLFEDMKTRGIPNPNKYLESPNTALVVVRAAVPPVIQIGDRIDIEVALPENSQATSLSGGWMMECELAEQAIVPGRGAVSGHTLARCEGPILVSLAGPDDKNASSGLRRGKILGGAVYTGGLEKKERRLGLYLRNEYRNVRNAKRISDRIGQRFHYFENGLKRPLAKATTDQHIELKVHPRYKENYIRFIQVVRAMSLNERSVDVYARMERLRKQLLDPSRASRAALELEAIGKDGIPALKEGLKSSSPEVRFYSADALAYLGDHAGIQELATVAEREPAFRVFALAALATLDDSESHEALKGLMDERGPARGDTSPGATEPPIELVSATADKEPGNDKKPANDASRPERDAQGRLLHGAEVRYGAYRTLWSIDKRHPFIRGEPIRDQFTLHTLSTEGEPMVHITRNRTPEVVLFGAKQAFRTPVALTAGRHITIRAASGSDTVTISRIRVDSGDEIKTCSTRIADIVRIAGSLGATYPDVAQMLVQAERQGNIPGRLDLDALPQAGRIYHRTPEDIALIGPSSTSKKTTVGNINLVPNIFNTFGDTNKPKGPTNIPDLDSLDNTASSNKSKKKSSDASTDEAGEASFADISSDEADEEESEEEPAKKSRFGNVFRNPFKGFSKAPKQSEPDLLQSGEAP
jgi:flagellar basal body P-ring protein FlgI